MISMYQPIKFTFIINVIDDREHEESVVLLDLT